MTEYRVYLVDGKGKSIDHWGGYINAMNEEQAIRRFKILVGATTLGIGLAIAKMKHGTWKAKAKTE